AGMPSSSAGLMRFFQDESHGPKLRPEYVMGASFVLIISVILAKIFLTGLIV
ncbi:preprotein translocase subunit Sec61beta, partial [Candidatus Bathyarchaeota archaeon]|nr:preprotein translocase subunit Sec61beta [Candidatus Bathyarchaeota archaeon]